MRDPALLSAVIFVSAGMGCGQDTPRAGSASASVAIDMQRDHTSAADFSYQAEEQGYRSMLTGSSQLRYGPIDLAIRSGRFYDLTASDLQIVTGVLRDRFYMPLWNVIKYNQDYRGKSLSAIWSVPLDLRDRTTLTPDQVITLAMEPEYALRVQAAADLLLSGKPISESQLEEYRDEFPMLRDFVVEHVRRKGSVTN